VGGGHDVLAMWADDWDLGGTELRAHVELGDVPTDLLLAAKSHVDNVVPEFALASTGAEVGRPPSSHLDWHRSSTPSTASRRPAC
jgi:hypothetical protein